MPEVGLLEEPLQAMQERLTQLLADWPENPILMQLLALCQRLAGESQPHPCALGGSPACASKQRRQCAANSEMLTCQYLMHPRSGNTTLSYEMLLSDCARACLYCASFFFPQLAPMSGASVQLQWQLFLSIYHACRHGG